MITLDKSWRVYQDDTNTILQYHEPRVKVKKSGKKEDYIYTDNYYYPNFRAALLAYSVKSIGKEDSINKVLERLDEIEELINKMK